MKLVLTSRIKLFLVIIAFAVFSAVMFLYGYDIVDGRNQARLDLVNQKRLELEILQREQKNFTQGKTDIKDLSEKTFPPQDLFSKDTKVVKEIRVLEELASRYSLDLEIDVAGSSKTATKVSGVSSELYLVPYTVIVEGAFNNILKYVDAVEHATFINQTKAIQITSLDIGPTRAEFNSEFYLKK